MARATQAASGSEETATEAPEDTGATMQEQASETAWPTLGRIVHFNIGVHEEIWRAALVIEERGGNAAVEVFLAPGDIPFAPGSRLALEGSRAYSYISPHLAGDDVGCWRWPPR